MNRWTTLFYSISIIVAVVTAACGLEGQVFKCPEGSRIDIRRGKCVGSGGQDVAAVPSDGGTGSTEGTPPAGNDPGAPVVPNPAPQPPAGTPLPTSMMISISPTGDVGTKAAPFRVAKGATITFKNDTGVAGLRVHGDGTNANCEHTLAAGLAVGATDTPCILPMVFINTQPGGAGMTKVYVHNTTRSIWITTNAMGF